jgi:hypothetical protein
MKVHVSLGVEGNVLIMVPMNKAIGHLSETKIMIARLYTQDEIDRETREAMQDGVRIYERVNRRVRQSK